MGNAGIANTADWSLEFPEDQSLLIRTDFSDDEGWLMLCEAACAPNSDGFQANLGFVDDRQLDGAPVEALLAVVDRGYFFVADSRAIGDPEHPILVVKNADPLDDGDPAFSSPRGATFRVIPSEIWGPENNLDLGNMDFEDFARSTEDDGVFRGFP